MIMFTGSTRTGKKVMARAAETLTPVSLELGGKDPMIVLSDADIERAANAAVYYSMQNGGQTCVSVERVYVEEPVYDDFVARVTEKARALRQGVPTGFGAVDIGAVTSPPQMDIIEDHVEDARAKGATIVVGGKRGPGPGDFFEPTVMTGVDHSMKAMTEETFGPTLPIMKVGDAEEAIRLANDSPYGLSGSVWTKDVAKGEAIARRVQSGLDGRQRRDAQLLGARAADGRLEGVGPRHAPRRGGHPQVLRPAGDPRDALRAQEGPAHVPVQADPVQADRRLLKVLYGRGKKRIVDEAGGGAWARAWPSGHDQPPSAIACRRPRGSAPSSH
jgi:hypothetical protein